MGTLISNLVVYSTVSHTVGQEDPHRIVQAFIDLIQRHEQSFYSFVHKVHSKGESLFDGLMRWIELFLTVVREGLGDLINLEFLLPHTGKERAEILSEVDKVALYHYKLKVAYEGKIRRRFERAQSSADAEDEATQTLVNGVVEEINFGELMRGDVDDIAAEETNADSEDDNSSADESTSNDDDDESDGSDESDDDEETSSEESIHLPDHKPPVRAQTTKISLRTAPVPAAPLPSRTHSLRSSRSMNFLLNRRDVPSASSAPPVPPVPPMFRTHHQSTNSWSSKPLPPSPASRSFTNRPPPPPSKTHHVLPKRKTKGKKGSEALKPPELHHIPQLLPVFVEMVRLVMLIMLTF